jgi:hypothetical protein
MRIFKFALALAATAFAAPQAMACFTVYNPSNQVVYTGPDTPIDLSYQIHERLPAAFPGGHMVFNLASDCQVFDARRVSPLLTNVPGAMSARSGTRPPRQSRN